MFRHKVIFKLFYRAKLTLAMFENMCLVSKTALFISDTKVSPTGKVKKNVFLVGTKQLL